MTHASSVEKSERLAGVQARRFQALLLLRGFTLIELLVTIALVAILMALAVPSFSDAALSSKLAANANRLAASATLARSEAIKRNSSIKLCISTNGNSCITTGGWEQGWIVLTGTTVLFYEQAAPTGFKITELASVTSLIFQATGVGSTQASFKVCRAMPNAGSQERVVSVSATGRTSVTKTATGVCT
ncbi:type IV fimbrial biogenesis protein FimT [Polaromonas sp. CG_9.5]|uniref:GspH/FimT family pseudopilin n=1 Tax=Polaromonas sp. CG_9.5 TaxID=3071705 RepID=UPI002E049BB9|nr:type IV fimbrial biogenesis protein FimT [Polaromonas sp. CG_9.5]